MQAGFVRFAPVLFGLCLGLAWVHPNIAQAQNRIPPEELDTTSQDSVMVFGKLKRWAAKHKLAKKATDFLFPNPTSKQGAANKAQLLKPYAKYSGKIIRSVQIEVFDVLGYSIYQPQKQPKAWYEKMGNAMHHTTRQWVLAQQLLFQEGDRLQPLKLSESERLVRSIGQIYDARVLVRPIPGSGDSVDIVVLAQDVWSLNGGAAYNVANNSGAVQLRESNFLGLAHRLEQEIAYNPDSLLPFSTVTNYIVPTIGRTYINALAYYYNRQGDESYGLVLNRPFYSPLAHWAGGLSVYHDLVVQPYLVEGKKQINTVYSRWTHDGWLGHAWNLSNFRLELDTGWQFVLAGRVQNNVFDARPPGFTSDTLLSYRNRTLLLGSLSLARRSFFKDRLIFGYGRTEDVPVGRQATVTFGAEPGQFYNRYYGGLTLTLAEQYHFGYVFASAGIGSFLTQESRFEQGAINLNLFYYTNALHWGRWALRHFAKGRLTWGFNRFNEEPIYLNRDNGLRGYKTSAIVGDKRAVINFETVLFTPFSFLGFRMAPFIFSDLALIGYGTHGFLNSRLFQAYGVGIRLRNEHLVFRTLQIAFAYYPPVPYYDPGAIGFLLENRPFLGFEQLGISRPDVQPYFQNLQNLNRTLDAAQVR